MAKRELQVCEFYNVVPTYVDRLARIEPHGPVTHLIWACRTQIGDADRPVAAVLARLIVPTAALPLLARKLAYAEVGADPGTDLMTVTMQ